MQQHLFEHFRSPGHTGFVEDVCITFIDKTRKCLVVRVIFAALYREYLTFLMPCRLY